MLASLLLGCQAAGDGSVAASSVSVNAISPVSTVTATFTPLPSLTATPTATFTPTPTPFVCSNQRGRTVADAFSSTAMQEEIRYLVHLPPCYDYYQDKVFPVLYLLHGWPLDEYHWVDLGITEIADKWISQGLVGPFIIVLPGVVNSEGLYVYSSGGPNSFEGMFVEELRPLVEKTYRTWRSPEGRAVGGISRGGVWALEIGLRHPEFFDIVGGHSPALSVNHPLPAYDPFVLAEAGAPGQRVYLDAGDSDWTRAGVIRLRDLFLEKDADITYQLHEGGHVDALWQLGLPDYLIFYTHTWPDSFVSLPDWIENPEEVWLEDSNFDLR